MFTILSTNQNEITSPNRYTFLHLSLDHDPKSIIIYGAGVIGSEYASIFRGLGVKVDLVNMRDRLLSFLDDEIGLNRSCARVYGITPFH